MTRALALILLITCAIAAPAEARKAERGRFYIVWADACDPVSGHCTRARRFFRNPVWR